MGGHGKKRREASKAPLYDEYEIVNRAYAFATKAHGDQKRKVAGRVPMEEPYVEHPKRVAARVAGLPGATVEMFIAALLHDVLEDTETTGQEILAEFGGDVLVLVEGLTDKFTAESHPEMNRKARKASELGRLTSADVRVKNIKLADIADNLIDTEVSTSFAEVFSAETQEILVATPEADAGLRREVAELAAKLARQASVAIPARRAAEKANKALQAQLAEHTHETCVLLDPGSACPACEATHKLVDPGKAVAEALRQLD